ncbi:MAG: outer membrane protein assembly factor BamA [Nitrospirae bacterium]|nr:MAG: outer membrane protein assembly factor BamA [Nitrospirota bacterium]
MRKIAVILSICLLYASVVLAQGSPLVNKIEVQGLKRIEEGAVKAKITQKLAVPVSPERTNEDIKAIFRMGYFEDVKVELEAFEGGVKLIYIVREKPIIIRIDFQGNKEYDDAKLKEKISITPGSISDTVLIQDNASKLKGFYEEEGYWLANIVPVTKKLTADEISLTYQIDEGSKVKIGRINIEGSKNLSASKIKKVMETREWWLFSFISSSGYFKKEKMETDVERIRNLYFTEGYLKVIIGEPRIVLAPDKKSMTVTIGISEGDVYKVSAVNITGNTAYDAAAIRKNITITPGSVFNKSLLEKNIQAITGLYSEAGYALTVVTPDLTPEDKDRTVVVTLSVNEGEKYRVGRIEVSGNTKTRDKVIRREIRFDEGELFSGSKLKRSYERINNLNYFETVDIVPKPNYEKKVVDLEVKVKERPTGMLSVGGGYSSVDKLIGTVDITQGNLFGRGQFVKVKAELGGKSSFYELSFKDPWFQDKPIALSTGIYNTNRDYTEYNKKAFGFFVGFGKDLSEYWRGDVSYNFERAEIFDIKSGASTIIRDQEGTKTTSAITPSVVRDSRDNYLDPSRGSRNALSFTFAGLGGSNSFIKATADSAWYFPVRDTAFMLRGRVGYARGIFNKTLPLYERYYVGGIYTVRGLGFGKAGPLDPATGEAIGGTTELIFNAEYIFPLLTEMRLKGVVFTDAGNSYENLRDFKRLRYTAGAGVRWISPIGPIRIEWGYNLDKKPGESTGKFEFAFGSFF